MLNRSGSWPQRSRLDQPDLGQGAPLPDGMRWRSVRQELPSDLCAVNQDRHSNKGNQWRSYAIFQIDVLEDDRNSALRIALGTIAWMIRVVRVGARICRLVTLFLVLMATMRCGRFRARFCAHRLDDCRWNCCRGALVPVMPAAPQHAVEQHGDECNPTDNLANHVTRFGDAE